MKTDHPLLFGILSGVFYFLFTILGGVSDVVGEIWMITMLFLPGITFPLCTCYFNGRTLRNKSLRIGVHLLLSIGIYYSAVWLFTIDGGSSWSGIAGFGGSFLFLLATKILLNKGFSYRAIIISSILSGLIFVPVGQNPELGFIALALGLLLWPTINARAINSADNLERNVVAEKLSGP